MSLVPDAIEGIESALAEELVGVRDLLELLGRESEQLASGIGGELDLLAAEKLVLGDRLCALAEQRERLLAACGIAGGMRELAGHLPAGSAAQRTLQRLRTAAQEAKARNQANGNLLGSHRLMLQARLAVLAGAIDAPGYGPDGAAPLGATRRAIAAA